MSVQAIAWAFAAKAGKPTAKLVLLSIANYADADGVCWPAQETIARDIEQSVDTVQRRLRDLEEAGLIKRRRRKSLHGGRFVYVLQMLKHMRRKPQLAAQARARSKGARLSRCAPEPEPLLCGLQMNHQEPPYRKQLPQNGKGSMAANGSTPKRRDRQRPSQRDRGALEVEVARRIGPDGFDVLGLLPDTDVDHLCQRQRRGTLDEATIQRLREGRPP